MNNHDYWNCNPPEPEQTVYIIDKVIINDPDEEFMYAVEEYIYETKRELSFLDPEDIRTMELIKNEGNNTALII